MSFVSLACLIMVGYGSATEVTDSAFMGLASSAKATSDSLPPNYTLQDTTYEWCDCKTGLESVTFWSDEDPSAVVVVNVGSVGSLVTREPVTKINWICDGMSTTQYSRSDVGYKVWSLSASTANKPGPWPLCTSTSGRLRVDTVASPNSSAAATSLPPNYVRQETTYDWCDCKAGLESVTFWSDDDPSGAVVVNVGSARWLVTREPVTKISWICNGMSTIQYSRSDVGYKVWSLSLSTENKPGPWPLCTSTSGRLRVNMFAPTNYITSSPFTSPMEDYACTKIPYLLRTNEGSLLAFAEARKQTCSDFARTDLVYRRSTDGGLTWSPLSLAVKPNTTKGVCGAELVVGNAAPVQLAANSKYHPGRILLPHTRDNFRFWTTYSDDDGVTWSESVEIPNVTQTDEAPDCKRGMDYYGFDIDNTSSLNLSSLLHFAKEIGWGTSSPFDHPGWREKMTGPWQFMGLGPAGSIQLKNGRLLAPGYHSWLRGLGGGNGEPGQLPVSQLYNNLAFGHVLISDDDGDTWQLGSSTGFGNGAGQGANEDQMVQLNNGSVLVNSRSLATGTPQYRVQARSDDNGETFTSTEFRYDLPEPFNGCQGSFAHGADDAVYVSHPDPGPISGVLPDIVRALGAAANLTGRDHMTIFKSIDGGATYPHKFLVDVGLTGYSSLQYYDGKLGLLYEQSDPASSVDPDKIFSGSLYNEVPTRFVFREIPESELHVSIFI